MEIKKACPLKDKNWFQTGGSAEYFCEPTTPKKFQEALIFSQDKNLPITLIGLGANMLISDDGVKGLVIHPLLKTITLAEKNNEISVVAGAGVTIEELINYCLDNNLIGLEEFSGIPGTVGGSVYINVHYFKYNLQQFVIEGQVIDKKTGEIKTVDRDWFEFGYDHSKLHDKKYFLVNATFKVQSATEVETAYARGRSDEIIRHRITRYPYKGTCGCFFRNFHDEEVTLEINGKKMIYVSYYLDKLGIKGELTIGGACVSHQHANMIVNTGNATSTDIIKLAKKMQELVKKQFSILPQTECQLVGFKENPLIY